MSVDPAAGRSAADPLVHAVTAHWDEAVDPAIRVAARRLAERYPGTAAVVFYGSCRRTGRIDGQMLDFYVLVDAMGAALPGRRGQALGARLVPPNVYYFESDETGRTVRAKVAVMTLAAFAARCRARGWDTSIWARFCQPCQPVWLRDEAARTTLAQACATAVCTMLAETMALAAERSAAALWSNAFTWSYGAEFRAERPGWRMAFYEQDRAYYDRITPPALDRLGADAMAAARARRRWRRRAVTGRLLGIARLMKAAATFDGGLDYLAWKLERHSGVAVEITPAMRRRPLRAGVRLFIRLRRRGAFR
ncbi:hypothetical protein CCR80_09115 [Rhodothalassium salexigens]|uniref:hypothetical protein n=1 Tax=Rhodothalassium salexigens TaxID=1086 RepID=UPI0019129BAF|nr:hypothetical protein [Rhodothalassium salexigens]MBK5921190.1 hypothetical protein [Rhodothalassium salexigens]